MTYRLRIVDEARVEETERDVRRELIDARRHADATIRHELRQHHGHTAFGPINVDTAYARRPTPRAKAVF